MLRITDLRFVYPRAKSATLEAVNAVFEPGRMTAITGPSGRGKSTLLYVAGIMLRPTAGQVIVDDVDTGLLSDASRARMRAKAFGFVFQDAALDSTRTVLDNVTESALYRGDALPGARRRATELLEMFGVELRSSAKPHQVSGGQAQRIALCRALLADPHHLLADEPTGNLDAASAAVVINALRARANAGTTVVVVTHDPNVIAACDREFEL
ncbi:ABC transporter ATP-binding protein [Galbitalea soli]|uniref:ATP-binding cassette domain-containing protein n=1 Tax=Galbitalea soli TaxID=1268042 RepID=A0A7C9PNG7_9MICO|nr:ATP-binding cassette domain-containing protein [Galbitalea soli]NEM91389.1 ATP-binding cassette domain-containing protein [Galbitalea soli]NYJ30080.1 ABC-type lipoprotein export system ATPase subunit [Galbitalea soli]